MSSHEQTPVTKRKRAFRGLNKVDGEQGSEAGPHNVRPWETAAAREWLERRAHQLSRSHQLDSSAAASSMARLVTVTDDPNEKVQAKTLPAMRHWKWAAASCLVSAGLILLLGFSVNKSAEIEQMLASAQRELASQKAELEIMQRSAGDANTRAGIAANTAAAQKLDLEQARQKYEALKMDLEAAQREFVNNAVAASRARRDMEASLAEANRQLDAQRRNNELIQTELIAAQQSSASLQMSAELAASERAKAVKSQLAAEAALTLARESLENGRVLADAAIKDNQLTEAALRQASAALQKERATADAGIKDKDVAEAALSQAVAALGNEHARAESTATDLERTRQELDAAKQVSTTLTASLEQEREKSISLAGYLSAARKAIDLVKTENERRAVLSLQSRKAVGASRLTSSLSRPARQPRSQIKHKSKAQRSSPGVVATITLPDALLPTSRPLSLSMD